MIRFKTCVNGIKYLFVKIREYYSCVREFMLSSFCKYLLVCFCVFFFSFLLLLSPKTVLYGLLIPLCFLSFWIVPDFNRVAVPKIRYGFVYVVTCIYDTLLFNKKINFLYNGCWWITIICFFYWKYYFCAFLVLAIFFVWKRFFSFKLRKENVANFVIGPPGSGKSTFGAFLSKWSKSLGYKMYSNVPLKGTYEYDWYEDFGNFAMQNGFLYNDETGLQKGLVNRDFKNNFKGEQGEKKREACKKHRHWELDMWFTSQWNDIDVTLGHLIVRYYLLKKMRIKWLMKIQIYEPDIVPDPQTGTQFVQQMKYKRTIFLFTPVVWLNFDTLEVDPLPEKEFRYRA